jgi:hypothetical protein
MKSLLFSAAIFAAGTADASESDLMLFGKDPGESKVYACYARHYDAVHLQTHKKQNVRDMVLFVHSYVDGDSGRQYLVQMGVTFRKFKTGFQTGGGCSPTEDGKPGLNCGIDCDGGAIDVSVKDAKSIDVSIPYGVSYWDPNSDDDQPPRARFGDDDKLFRLERTKMSDCLPFASDDEDKAEMAGMK